MTCQKTQYLPDTAFSVGNKVNDTLQNVASSSPVVACKNTVGLLERGVDVGG